MNHTSRRMQSRLAWSVAFVLLCGTGAITGCGSAERAEQAFESLFQDKKKQITAYLKDEDYELIGFTMSREIHNTGGDLTGTITLKGTARQGKILSAEYHYDWKDGGWKMTSHTPASISNNGGSVSIPKIDHFMEEQ